MSFRFAKRHFLFGGLYEKDKEVFGGFAVRIECVRLCEL